MGMSSEAQGVNTASFRKWEQDQIDAERYDEEMWKEHGREIRDAAQIIKALTKYTDPEMVIELVVNDWQIAGEDVVWLWDTLKEEVKDAD